MKNINHCRETLDVAALIGCSRPDAAFAQNCPEFAPTARMHQGLGLLVGQQLWSLPLPCETLDRTARAAKADVLMFRDMKDREPLMSVRCDAAVWLNGEKLLILRDLIPHYGLSSPPAFMTREQDIALMLTSTGLTVTPCQSLGCLRHRIEGAELASRILLGRGF